MKLYCDASAFTAIILGDATAGRVADCLDASEAIRLYSDLGWGELIAAIGRHVRLRKLSPRLGTFAISRAGRVLEDWTDVPTQSSDVTQAALWLTDFSLALKLPDAIHIAIAHRIGATLVSTDRQQVVAARALGIDCINPIEETT